MSSFRSTEPPPRELAERVLTVLAGRGTSLRMDPYGVLRVGASLVRLATVVEEFRAGSAPHEIQEEFPSLTCTEIDSVIEAFLDHRSLVDSYLAEWDRYAAERQRVIEERDPPEKILERLLARRAAVEAEDAAPVPG